MTVQDVVLNARLYLVLALGVIAGVSALAALVHAVSTRADAFTAVDAQSKTFWVALLAGSNVLIWLFVIGGLGMMVLFLVGVVASMVYIVDVRVRVDEILNRNWFRKLG
ncbi:MULTISPECIES: DUF2516 family protein [Gordonia]|uniref:DUF2516 family protein n=1 Tax=Gordonia malaquae NBRC 108250 TaxID=1223542 RepID=M3THT3_GORML|nr:DUF2516 family protein [Gordonia malaquae]GAC81066.1 hypothetical protein GM1_026_00340 [Gordonia malaquae NBRC 108250]SEB75690.1 Protein of unknown function [Gordonia malaquae]